MAGITSTGQWTLGTGKLAAAELSPPPLPVNPEGAARSLADWGFENAVLVRQSLALDTLSAVRPAALADATPEIDFGQLVILTDPRGVRRFVGRRVLVPGQASGAAESQQYQFAGPWYWLEKLVFHQTWTQLLISGALVARQTSHLLLNTGGVSIGATIQAIAQYAIDQGAPFQIGIIDIPVVPIVTEVTDQTCAQLITYQLRSAPNAVAWFDYSTNPPTFHCRQAPNLTAVSLALGLLNIPTIADEGLTIAARPDLQIPAVALRYERTDTLNGVQYLALGEDVYPPGSTGRELNALSQTITLAGFNITTLSAAILCETIDTTSIEWWKRVIPKLQDQRIRNLSLVANTTERILQGSRTAANLNGTPSSAFGRMLVEGQLVDWMRDATNNVLDWEQEEASAQFQYDFYESTSPTAQCLEKNLKVRIPVHLVSTNAPAGVSDYSTTQSEEEGESQPVGLAQYLYNALSGLEYEGSINTTNQECTGFIGPGNVLNLTGTAQATHSTMRARVQSVVEQIATGMTKISFGPTPALSVGAILELLRASRHRRRWTRTSVQSDGEQSASLTAKLGEATANNNTIPGDAQKTLFAVLQDDKKIIMDVSLDAHSLLMQAGSAGQYIQAQLVAGEARQSWLGPGGNIILHTADCTYLGIPRTLSVKVVKSCDPTDPAGSSWVRLVVCSDRIRIS